MSPELPQLLSDSEEGFVDLTFGITSFSAKPDGSLVFRAEALQDTDQVGLQVELSADWDAGTLGGNIPAHSGIVTYRSIGATSDRFLALLDNLYESRVSPLGMKETVTFAGITLGDDPSDLCSKEIHIKLFFEDDDESAYAEVYTNINLPDQRLQIREKDEAYRGPLIRALAR